MFYSSETMKELHHKSILMQFLKIPCLNLVKIKNFLSKNFRPTHLQYILECYHSLCFQMGFWYWHQSSMKLQKSNYFVNNCHQDMFEDVWLLRLALHSVAVKFLKQFNSEINWLKTKPLTWFENAKSMWFHSGFSTTW